jgi:hypothetical protein
MMKNPKQVRRAKGSKSATTSKPQSLSQADTFTLDLPGICTGHKWDRHSLYRHLANALARMGAEIRTKVFPHITEENHLADLYDALSFATSFEACLDDGKPHRASGDWSVVSFASFDADAVGRLMALAVFENDAVLIKHLHTCGRDNVIDLLLGEALVIAETLATADGLETELSKGSTHTRAAEIAWAARASFIRTVAQSEAELPTLPAGRAQRAAA